MTSGEQTFDYDLAFSFLAKDEAIVLRISELLRGRFAVFVYSEQQKKLAGRDGEEAFADVFARQARVVVIFHREGWGQTSWTRIEETAIRGRAHEEGYDFTLWVPLDKDARLPPWLPKNRLWFNFERFGDTGLQAVIEQLIQERGGDTKPETLTERAERMERDVRLGEARNNLVNGYDHATAQKAAASAQKVSDQFSAWIETGVLPRSSLKRDGSHALLVSVDRGPRAPICLTVAWLQRFSNHLGPDARICATIFEGIPHFRGIGIIDEPTVVTKISFAPDLNSAYDLCWRERGDGAELSPSAVVDIIARRLMDEIARLSAPRR